VPANFHDILSEALVVVEFVLVHHNLPSGSPSQRVHGFSGRICKIWVVQPGPLAHALTLPVVPPHLLNVSENNRVVSL
jgi:hypothetical protein